MMASLICVHARESMEVSVSALADEDSSHTEAFVQCLDLSVPLKKRLHRIWEYQLDRRAS